MEEFARRALLAVTVSITCLLPYGIGIGTVEARSHSATARPCIFDHAALATSPGTCKPRALRYPGHVKGPVRRSIYDSALIFGVPYQILLAIAKCESSLNPQAVNGNHLGLYQFVPQTFHRGARQLLHDTGIQASTPWSPSDASYVAGYLFAVGKAPSWACE